MGIKNNIFALKKATWYSLLFVQPSLDAGNSLKWLLGIFQDGGPLTHSQVLSTFQDGGRVKFPTLGTVVDVKIPTHVRFTKSNSRGLPGPPILGQTIDRCITISQHLEFKGKIQNNPNKQITTTTERCVPWSDLNFPKVCS